MMRTANPALNAKTFVGLRPYEAETAMTIQGAVNKRRFYYYWRWCRRVILGNYFLTHGIRRSSRRG